MPFNEYQLKESDSPQYSRGRTMFTQNISKFDILRSDQKDKFYRKKLNNLTDELIKSIYKPSTPAPTSNGSPVQSNAADIKLLSDLLYYGSTTIANRQTIGQEYYNLILFNEATRNVPAFHERAFIVLFRIVLPYLMHKLNKTRSNNPRGKLIMALTTLLLYYAKKINLIAFYLRNTSYFKLENRLACVKTLSVNLGKSTSSYQQKMSLVLGVLELAMLILHAGNELKDFYVHRASIGSLGESSKAVTQAPGEVEESKGGSPTRINCPLCLEKVCHPTLTSCGHMFCWDCIQNYSAYDSTLASSKCPTCRNVFESRRLIYLYNFK